MAPVQPNTEPVENEEERSDDVIGRAFVLSLVLFAVLGLVGVGVAWWMTRKPPVAKIADRQVALPTGREAATIAIPAMPFADITEQAGITFRHENGSTGEKLLPETMGSGCAFFDFDSDGDQDLLFLNSQRWPWDKRTNEVKATPALYANDGHGSFTDVTAETGLDLSMYGMGIAVGDYDNDGDSDLFFTAVGNNRLMRNDGGRFVDVTAAAGVAGESDAWGTSCGWLDCDNDGDLDLVVCHYVAWSREADIAQNFQIVGGGRAYGRPQHFGGTYPSLYRNNGDGTFADVSAESGLQITNPDTQVPAGKTLGLVFADFDADGWLDIAMANDTVGNFLFRNRGDGTYEEIGYQSGFAYDSSGLARGAMGIDAAYFRNNGEVGVAIGNFANEMTALYVAKGKNLQFRDDAVSNGLGPNTRLELTFGIFFFDADLDGRLDLFAANGHLEEEIHRVQLTQFYAQPPHFFWNCGSEHSTEFLPVPKDKCGEALLQPVVGRGAACADIDGDGDLDLAVSSSGGPARLFRNDQQLGQHWLQLKLRGSKTNRDAIGTVVELQQGQKIQRRLVNPTRSYLSQCDATCTFGLGEHSESPKVIVRWPSGKVQELTDLKIDQLHVVEE